MRLRPLLARFVVAACVLAAGRSAAAEESGPPSRSREWHLGLEAMTDFPIQVGGQLTLEVPYGLRVSVSAGAFIRPYADLINDTIVASGGYDQRTADVISATLGDSIVWNVHLGWRPFRAAGFYIATGYRQVILAGRVDPADVVEIATGQTIPQAQRDLLERSYAVTSTLHMVDVELGWELVFVRRLILRFGLGAALTVGARTEIPRVRSDVPSEYEGLVDQTLVDEEIDRVRLQAGDHLDSIYRRYVFVPTISIGIGYRFF
jgi:hypothetical protein